MPIEATTPKREFFIMKIFAALLLVGLFAILTLQSNQQENIFEKKPGHKMPDLSPAPERNKAPNFTFTLASGSESSINKMQGSVLYINFWAKWCEPCTRELPVIEELSKLGYLPILVNLDEGKENYEQARQLQLNLAPTAATLYEGQSESPKKLIQTMQIEAIPFHILIDKSGRIAAQFYAPLDKNKKEFKNLILQLLAEEAPEDLAP